MTKNIEETGVNSVITRCVRCKGRKKLFKLNSIYSYTNTGGVEVECPMCLGTGINKPLINACSEIKEEVEKRYEKIKAQKSKEKDFTDEKTDEKG